MDTNLVSSLQPELTEDTEKTRRSPVYASIRLYNCLLSIKTAGQVNLDIEFKKGGTLRWQKDIEAR